VLVVDDNATNRLVLREFLAPQGAQVCEAEDGAAGLVAIKEAQLEGDPFELVLLDCRMPEMDGFHVAEQLRDEAGGLDTTIIMLTSDNRQGDVARAGRLGLAAYLV
jgi:CheY-like chemotaxis protein